jgi:hypothetical protein
VRDASRGERFYETDGGRVEVAIIDISVDSGAE